MSLTDNRMTQMESELAELRRIGDAKNKMIAHQAAQIRQLQSLTSSKKESYYQQLLEEKLKGKRMYISGVGTTDITTSDMHIEIKRWSRYHEVPGQLAKYQQGCRRPKSTVYFFGTIPSLARQQQITALMAASRIDMYSIDGDDEITEHKPSSQPVSEKSHFARFMATKGRKHIGNKLHVHYVRDQYVEWLRVQTPPILDIKSTSTSRIGTCLKVLNWSTGPATTLHNCTQDCKRKRSSGPVVFDLKLL